jgi:hypothetical protein
VQRREGIIHGLRRQLDPRRYAGVYDEAGRRILGGYQAISDFLMSGMNAA